MRIKKIGYGTHLILYSLIFLAILVVINFIFLGKFYRKDLTENRIYSISKATKDTLRSLDDVINIHVYFSKELPPQLVELRRQVQDILGEYTAYAGKHLAIDFIDPEDDPELQNRMQFIGVPKVQVNIFQRDKAEVANVYLGMSIMFEDRKEVIPIVQDVKNFEYDLTSAILKVIKKEPEVVGFVTWKKDEQGLQQDNYTDIQRALEKQYEVRNISLSAGDAQLKDVDTLIAIEPEDVKDEEKTTLDEFLIGGGKQIYLINTIRLQKGRQLSTETVNTNLMDLLEKYGVKVEPDLVLDRSNSMAAFSGGFFSFQVPYPFWPKVVKDGFDQTHPMVSKLDNVTFPWTSSVRIKEEVVKEKGLNATILAQTTPHGWTQRGRFDLNPQQRFNLNSANFERVPLAVMISGKFENLSAQPAKENKDEIDSNVTKKDEDKQTGLSQKDAQIVVIGNARFIENDFLGRFPENSIFFLNIVDWLTMGDSLIGIRSREKTDRPLPELSDQKKMLIRYINIFGMSFLLILFGLIKFLIKKRKRIKYYEL